jgi:predicted polyphosphate/ATP-dependent NAD kinase
MQNVATKKPTLGIIANPYSSCDIRRLISSATSIQTVERANIIVRVIVASARFGIEKVVIMPDKSGLAAQLLRNINSLQKTTDLKIPEIEFLEIPISGSATDSQLASQRMRAADVSVVLVLGGDGTHRVVAKEVGDIPLASISTGTNNAFPRFQEATLVGMAIGLYASGSVPIEKVIRRNKLLHVSINDERKDVALVDLAVTNDRWIGAKALWDMKKIRELYLTFCEPGAIGMSAIGGLLEPVSRSAAYGLKLVLADDDRAEFSVNTPIAPGLFEEVGIVSAEHLDFNQPHELASSDGVIALDGEREIEFSHRERVVVEIRLDGPLTLDIDASLKLAVANEAFITRKVMSEAQNRALK